MHQLHLNQQPTNKNTIGNMKVNLNNGFVFTFVIALFNLIFVINPSTAADTICESAFDSNCTNTTICCLVDNLYGYGYKSILSSSITFAENETTLSCQGGFSCFVTDNSDNFEFFQGGTMQCYGDHSCSNMVVNTNEKSSSLTCGGSNSCDQQSRFPSIITSNVKCAGDQSCSGSAFMQTRTLNVFGAFGMLGASMTGPTASLDPTVTINLYGYYAGWAFEFMPDPIGNDVTINCFGNGCNNTYYFDMMAASIFNTSSCYKKGVACPVEAMDPPYSRDPSVITAKEIFLINSSQITNSVNNMCDSNSGIDAIVADDYQSKKGINEIQLNGVNRSLCCRGAESCSSVNDITLNWDVSNDGALYCAAFGSCNDVSNIEISNEIDGDVDIICSGDMSCVNTTITFNDNNNSVIGNVYCLANGACMDTTIINATNVYCTVGSDDNTGSCHNAVIRGAKNVYMLNGGPSKVAITIYGRTGDTNGTNIYFKAYNSGTGAQIYCLGQNTKCTVSCETNTACSNQTTLFYCASENDCAIICDPSDGIDCPKLIEIAPTNGPTSMPTTLPTVIPTAQPTMLPTSDPVVGDTTTTEGSQVSTTRMSLSTTSDNENASTTRAETTSSETTSSTLAVTSTISVSSTVSSTVAGTKVSTTEEEEEEDPAAATIRNFDSAGLYFVFGILVVSLGLLLIAIIYHKLITKGSDSNNLFGLVRFFASVADFWTDLLFSAILYFETQREDSTNTHLFLFIASTACVGCAYVFSCVFGVYWISRMRVTISGKNSSHRLLEYFKKYDMFIYGMSTIAGFYATIDLARSKLFYLDIFHLQLTHEEYTNLKMFRFGNIVLLENIPQFIVQVIYINITENENISSIVFLSLTLSVLSVIAASLSQVSRMCNKCRNVEKYKYSHRCELTGSIVIESNQFKKAHACAHKKIENCISDVIATCKDSNLWNKRSDVSYSIEVYYIQNYINTLNQIEFSFEILLLTMGDNIYDITNALNDNLEAMDSKAATRGGARGAGGSAMMNNNRILCKALIQTLNITKISKIIVKQVNMVTDEINQKGGNSTDVNLNVRIPAKSLSANTTTTVESTTNVALTSYVEQQNQHETTPGGGGPGADNGAVEIAMRMSVHDNKKGQNSGGNMNQLEGPAVGENAYNLPPEIEGVNTTGGDINDNANHQPY